MFYKVKVDCCQINFKKKSFNYKTTVNKNFKKKYEITDVFLTQAGTNDFSQRVHHEGEAQQHQRRQEQDVRMRVEKRHGTRMMWAAKDRSIFVNLK